MALEVGGKWKLVNTEDSAGNKKNSVVSVPVEGGAELGGSGTPGPGFVDFDVSVKPTVPDAAFAFIKDLQYDGEKRTGADPGFLKAAVPKSKKITKVAPSPAPDPGNVQENKNVETHPARKQTRQNSEKDFKTQPQVRSPQTESAANGGKEGEAYPSDVSGRLGHDPKTCRIYGCLMCKSAKEKF